MKMKKRDISLRGNIQRQKDVGYNLMDKYLGALAGLAEVKTEVSMINITELETLARAATPGEWEHLHNSDEIGPVSDSDGQSHGMVLPVAWIERYDYPDQCEANAAYIAAANPQTMLKLCEVIRVQHEALWTLMEHNALHYGESHNTVIEGRAALAKANEILGDK